MRVILIILKLIGRIILIPVWLILTFIGVCVSAVVNLYCVAKDCFLEQCLCVPSSGTAPSS